jgi:zinc transport system substrate-binding protein
MKKNLLLVLITLALSFQSLNLLAKPIAFVSILPQKFLLQSLAKELLDVKVLVKPGQSPETFDPTPRQMAELSTATLYFTIGLDFEQNILTRIIANNKKLNVIKTYNGIEESSLHHDPHIWLDPLLVQFQSKIIYQALIKAFPEHLKELQQRFQLLQQQLDKLDNSIGALFINKGKLSNTTQLSTTALSNKRSFVIFHPALTHFAKRYQLKQIAIEHEGKTNSAKYMADLMGSLKQQSVKYILVEKQFSKKEAQTVAKVIQADLLEIDPLAESWLENMYDIANKVRQALF